MVLEPGVPGSTSDLASLEREAAQLLHRYIRCVDDADLEGWSALFGNDSSYIVTTRDNLSRCPTSGPPIGFVHDHTKDRILDRVTLVRKAWEGHFDEYRTRHVVGLPGVEHKDGRILMRANLALYITEEAQVGSVLLAVGEYVDELRLQEGTLLFGSKMVVLDTEVLPRYFTYPL